MAKRQSSKGRALAAAGGQTAAVCQEALRRSLRSRHERRGFIRTGGWLAFLAVVMVPAHAVAQEASQLVSQQRPQLDAVRASEPPVIDGRLDEPVWATAPAASAFIQKFPNEGQRPSDPTVLRVLYDSEFLYVAFECVQQNTPIEARLARRDRVVESDRVELNIHDGTRGLQFSVNAAGVLSDGIRFNDTDYSADWNGVWEGRVARSERGWSVEMGIPLRIFRFDEEQAQTWDLQARRYISMRQEIDEWAYIPRAVAGEVSHYGKLTNLVQLRHGSPVELRPFVLGRVGWYDMTGSGGLDNGSIDGSIGLDARWYIMPDLALDVALNPDFAQVEADQEVLNLTTFETFSPEKRPFFLDGMDIFQLPRMELFQTPQTLFYTRRIGSVPPAPAVRGDAEMSERIVSAPEPSTIYGAAKLIGTLVGDLSGGFVSALTARNNVLVEQADLATEERLAEPLTLSNIARLRLALGNNAYLGLWMTAANRFEDESAYPLISAAGEPILRLCPGGYQMSEGDRCFHDSYVAAIDGHWRSRSGTYVISGLALATAILDGPPRVLPDGTTVQSGDMASGARAFLSKEGGQWLGSLELEFAGRRLDYNDLGYMRRQNQVRIFPNIEYRALKPFWHVLEARARIYSSIRQTLDGLDLWQGYYLGTEWQFNNFWTVNTILYHYRNRFDDREVGDGTALERSGLIGWDLNVKSDPRQRIYGSFYAETLFIFNGFSFILDGELSAQVSPQLELQLIPKVTYTFGEPRYIGAGAQPGEYLFGRLDARSIGTTLRSNYTFTNQLTLQLYAQLLLVAKHYSELLSYTSDVVGPRPAIKLSDLEPAAPLATSPDQERATLNLNAVLRWEFMRGSTLFLVYTRFQEPDLALDNDRSAKLNIGALRGGPAASVLWLKLSYWWN